MLKHELSIRAGASLCIWCIVLRLRAVARSGKVIRCCVTLKGKLNNPAHQVDPKSHKSDWSRVWPEYYRQKELDAETCDTHTEQSLQEAHVHKRI